MLFVSTFFYAWSGTGNLVYVVVLLNYLATYLLYKFHYKWILACVILLNIASLIYFKYINYFLSNIRQYLSLEVPLIKVAAPLGISFIIFCMVSYHVDNYNKKEQGLTSFMGFGLYIMFFLSYYRGLLLSIWDDINKIYYVDIDKDNLTKDFAVYVVGQ